MTVDFDVKGFFTGRSIIMDYGSLFWPEDILIDGLESCGLLVDYSDVFISCLDSCSDGTHSLQMIHWWASDVMLHFSKFVSVAQTNLLLGWPEGVYI